MLAVDKFYEVESVRRPEGSEEGSTYICMRSGFQAERTVRAKALWQECLENSQSWELARVT